MSDELRTEAELYALVVEVLQRTILHPGQVDIAHAICRDLVKEIMAVCGRNWGKTEVIVYVLHRVSLFRPGTHNYYFAPEQKQAREILWASRRLQQFAPEFHQSKPNETEMRITFKNGSFIKLDGSDNVDQYRGVKPPKGSVVVYDEFKDFRASFHAAMDPNLQHCQLMILGTPPEMDNHFTEMEDLFIASTDLKHRRYFNFPSSTAPHNSHEWLERQKKDHYAKGEGDVYEREYMARRVRGGKNAIFPMAAGLKLTPHADVMAQIRRDIKKLEWYTITDPGTTTCHATLFVALNRYTRRIYLLDEIYETNQAETATSKIGARIINAQAELTSGVRVEWDEVADEAAQWFITEMDDRHGHAFRPTEKNSNKKETGISIIKDALLRGLITVSDRCVKWLWEMQNYIKDEHGRIPKENDHLIDDTRYFIAAAHYTLEDEKEPVPEHLREDFRGARPEDDFPELEDIRADDF